MNELHEINSVMVHGEMTGPRNVVVLKLGIAEGDDSYQSYISFVLNKWGAQAIMDSLYSAGVTPKAEEEKEHKPLNPEGYTHHDHLGL